MSPNTRNPEVERAVLGTVLSASDPAKAWAVASEIVSTPLAFSDRNLQILVLVMTELWGRGKAIDPVSLAEGVKQVPLATALESLRGLRGKPVPLTFDPDLRYEDSALPEIGGFGFVGELATGFAPAAALRTNCQILMEYYQLRQAIELLKGSAGRLDSPSGRVDLRRVVENTTESLIKVLGGRSGTRTAADAMDAVVLASLDAKLAKTKPLPLWPLTKLDKMCRMKEGSMITLAGTSGGGKTSLALQTAVETARKIATEGCVGFISREMTADDLAAKVLAQEGGLSADAIANGEVTEVSLREANAKAKEVLGANGTSIAVCDTMERLSHKEVCAWARSLFTRTGGNLRLLVVDHIGILDGESPKQNEYERQTAATRAFKALAMELRIVVLVLCQLNKQGTRGSGQRLEEKYGAEDFSMVDLKGAGSVAHDADMVVFICKQGHDDGAHMPVIIKCDKNRWGPKGNIPAIFDKANNQRFIEPKDIKHGGSMNNRGEPSDREDLF